MGLRKVSEWKDGIPYNNDNHKLPPPVSFYHFLSPPPLRGDWTFSDLLTVLLVQSAVVKLVIVEIYTRRRLSTTKGIYKLKIPLVQQ